MSIDLSFIDLINTIFLIYGIGICLTYLMLSIVSAIELRSYLKKNIKVDWDIILNSSYAPKISLIAPAYNEGATIIDNVRSMLSLRYKKLEIIIVNDGSKDDSLEKLIKTLGLKKVKETSQGKIPTSKVRGVYRSERESLKNLIILDKENGGKSDALNAGINLSSGEFIACVDVDCILDRNCLLKLVKPFLEDDSVILSPF